MNKESKNGDKESRNFLDRALPAIGSILVGVILTYLFDYFVFKRNIANVPETQEVQQVIAQQYIVQNVFLGILILVLLGISACVYILVRRNDPAPSFNIFEYEDEIERDMMHKRVAAIIKGARDSIIAVNAWREEDPPDTSKIKYREGYFEELIKATQQASYIRYVQIDKGKGISTQFDNRYVEHFKMMLHAKKASPKEISLYRIEPVVPTTFVIVDNKYLLWQLNEVNPYPDSKGHKRFSMRAVVIVDGGDFVKHFKKIYESKCVNSTSKQIINKESELG